MNDENTRSRLEAGQLYLYIQDHHVYFALKVHQGEPVEQRMISEKKLSQGMRELIVAATMTKQPLTQAQAQLFSGLIQELKKEALNRLVHAYLKSNPEFILSLKQARDQLMRANIERADIILKKQDEIIKKQDEIIKKQDEIIKKQDEIIKKQDKLLELCEEAIKILERTLVVQEEIFQMDQIIIATCQDTLAMNKEINAMLKAQNEMLQDYLDRNTPKLEELKRQIAEQGKKQDEDFQKLREAQQEDLQKFREEEKKRQEDVDAKFQQMMAMLEQDPPKLQSNIQTQNPNSTNVSAGEYWSLGNKQKVSEQNPSTLSLNPIQNEKSRLSLN